MLNLKGAIRLDFTGLGQGDLTSLFQLKGEYNLPFPSFREFNKELGNLKGQVSDLVEPSRQGRRTLWRST